MGLCLGIELVGLDLWVFDCLCLWTRPDCCAVDTLLGAFVMLCLLRCFVAYSI